MSDERKGDGEGGLEEEGVSIVNDELKVVNNGGPSTGPRGVRTQLG